MSRLGIDRMLGEAEHMLRGTFEGAARRLVDALGSRATRVSADYNHGLRRQSERIHAGPFRMAALE